MRDQTELPLRLRKLWDNFSETANSISQFIITIIIQYFRILNLLLWNGKKYTQQCQGNIEICCYKRMKNSHKNFQISLTLVHLMIPFQQSLISIFNLFKNIGKLRRVTYWPTFENFNFLSFSRIGKSWEVHPWATFKCPTLQSLYKLGKNVSTA